MRTLHPLALFGTSLLSFSVALFDPHTSHLLACVAVCVVLQLSFGMWRQMLGFIVAISPFYVIVDALTALAYGDMALTLPIFLRIFVLGLTCVPMFTVREADLVRSLQTLRASRGLTLAVLISMRFAHVMAVQAKRVAAARRTMPRLKQSHKRVSLWRMLVPLLDRALSIGDDLTHSLELRGFTLRSDITFSVYKTVRMQALDYVWVALWLALNMSLCALWIMEIA